MAMAAIAVALSPLHAQTTAPTGDNLLLAVNTDATLPVDDGDWHSLGLLASTANLSTPAAGGSGDAEADIADGRSSSPDNGSAITYGGITPTQNDTTLDGLSLQQNFRSRSQGSSNNQASFGQSAVLAFRVMPQTYSAQFGDAAGAVLAITSRTPTNAWHGSAFSTLRNSALDATNPFSVVTQYRDGTITNSLVKPNDTILRIGGHISIPLRHHLAAFASWDEMLRNDPAIASPAIANFYTLTPTQSSLLANRGVTSADTNAALNYLDSLTGTVARHSTRALGFLRIDNQLTKRNHLTLTYTRDRIDLPASSGFGSTSNAVINSGTASVGDSFVSIDAAAVHWQHDFSTKLRNILRAQFVRDFEYETPRTPLPQEPAIAPGGFAPEIEIAPNGFTYGTPANLGRSAYPDEKRIQATEQIEWAHRKHLFTAGFDWSHIDDRIASFTNPDGIFLYDSSAAGHAGGLVDWITDYTFNVNAYPNGGCPSIHAAIHDFCFRIFTQNFGPTQTEFITHTFDGYLEGAIRASHTLQLTFGVRYQYILLPFPQTPNTVLDADLQTLATQFQGTTASFPEDRNNFAPRIALAWSPHNAKWFTAHLGYGWFYGRLPGTTVRAALTDTATTNSTLQIRIRPTNITACPQGGAVPNQGFGYPCAYTTTPPAAVAETSDVLLFAKNFRLPAVQRATLSLERGLGKHIFLRASYAMAFATQLPSTTDLNIAPSTSLSEFTLQTTAPHPGIRNGETFVVPLYTTRRLTQYGPITALVSTANETYHSGTLEAELRDWHNLSLRGSFTFSRAIDYAPQISGTPQQNGQFDPFRNGYDKGLSTLNFPERFAGDAIWRTPEKHGPHWLRHTSIAALATAGSGAPYSYEISGGSYLSGGRESINGSGGATYLPTIGRNTLHLPPRGNLDLRLERTVGIHKNIHISAIAEAFNLLNERTLTRIETRAFLPQTPVIGITPLVFQDAATIATEGLTTPAFGQPTSSTAGVKGERELQLGLRLDF
jgi:hypothetical protein